MTPRVKAIFADNYYVDRYLEDLLSCRISFAYYIPADIAYLSFYCTEYIEQIREIEIEYKGSTVFVGNVDIQHQKRTTDGYVLSITARSLEGKMLDSEAAPKTYYYPTTSVIYDNHIRYFGVEGVDVPSANTVSQLSIDSSTSEWEVICNFFSLSHQKIPYIAGDRILRLREISSEVKGHISNSDPSDDVIHYKSVDIKKKTADLISNVYIINGDTGELSSTIVDSYLESMGFYSARYKEYDPEDIPAMSNHYSKLIKKQKSEAFTYTFEMDDGYNINLGDALDFDEPEHPLTIKLIVIKKEFSFDKDGIRWSIVCTPQEYCY